jgi:dTDP-4-amino-4,6-dideoxy-D-galactose acyltransferase
MSAPCELLPWDSSFFGFTAARVLSNHLDEALVCAIDSWSEANEVTLLYLEASIDDPVTVRLAESHGFRLVDVRVVLSLSLPSIFPETLDLTSTRPATEADLTGMVRMCRNSFRDSRFYFDQQIPDEVCTSLYERWIEESCSGYADRVFVALDEESPGGFITCHWDAETRTGRIGLVAVDDRSRGRGIGEVLVARAQAWFSSQGAETATVTTQARNLGAQGLYNKRGFRVSRVSLYYHKWYESESVS